MSTAITSVTSAGMPADVPCPTSSKTEKYRYVGRSRLNRTLQDRLRDAQADRDTRLVVQVPRLDVPALRDRRLRVEADKVADLDPELADVVRRTR